MAEKTKKAKSSKTLNIIGLILCIILIPVLIFNITLIVKSYTNKDKIPSAAGYFPMIILSDSMSGEFESGDLIFCKEVDAEDIKVGDIICYYDPSGNGTTTVTHRVLESKDDNGTQAWLTKGDANNAEDQKLVPYDNLLGIYIFKLSGLGNAAMFMQSTTGLIICVVVPVILFSLYDFLRRRAVEKSNDKDKEALMEELNALKEEKAKAEQNNE